MEQQSSVKTGEFLIQGKVKMAKDQLRELKEENIGLKEQLRRFKEEKLDHRDAGVSIKKSKEMAWYRETIETQRMVSFLQITSRKRGT